MVRARLNHGLSAAKARLQPVWCHVLVSDDLLDVVTERRVRQSFAIRELGAMQLHATGACSHTYRAAGVKRHREGFPVEC